ncbi:MAG: hypothetical protein ACP5JR_04595 [Thermoplasmata archaeon]
MVWDYAYDPSYIAETHGSGIEWTSSIIWEEREWEGWYYERGLGIEDVDPQYPGNEIVHGYWNLTVIGYNRSTGQWEATMVFDYPYSPDGWKECAHHLAIGDFDSAHEGDEILTVTYMGRLYETYWDNTTWNWITENNGSYEKYAIISDRGHGIFCLVDVNKTNNVMEIVSRYVMIMWNGTGFEAIEITPVPYSSTDRMGGAMSVGVCDVWLQHPGDEVLITGFTLCSSPVSYEDLVMFWEDHGVWYYKDVYLNPTNNWSPFHYLAIGDFDREHPGVEIAVTGDGNNYEFYTVDTVNENTVVVWFCAMGVVGVATIWQIMWRRRMQG